MPATVLNQLLSLKPIIGMVHLAPLPGAPLATDTIDMVIERALADAQALAAGGCHALMMENFGDVPFFPGRVPATVVAAMTRVAVEIKRQTRLPLGINVLRNDGLSALAIAVASGAEFIRVNVLTGARVTDQGVIQGIAHDLLRERAQLGAESVAILADVDVKHSAPLAARPLADEVKDAIVRGLADGLVVSGAGTGAATDPAKVAEVKRASGSHPVFIGSGVTAETLKALKQHADGFIVGTALKVDGRPTSAVDVAKVKALLAAHTNA